MSTELTQNSPASSKRKPSSKAKNFALSAPGIFTGLAVGATMIFGVLSLTSTPALATNEQVRTVYSLDIIDNPNFTGKDMLKVNEEKLAELCVRPTVKDVENKVPLNCHVIL